MRETETERDRWERDRWERDRWERERWEGGRERGGRERGGRERGGRERGGKVGERGWSRERERGVGGGGMYFNISRRQVFCVTPTILNIAGTQKLRTGQQLETE